MFHSYFGITRRYSLDFYGPVATPRVMDQSMIAMSAPHSAHSAPDRLLDVFGAPHVHAVVVPGEALCEVLRRKNGGTPLCDGYNI